MRLSTAVSCVFLAVFSLLNSAHAIVFFSQGNDYNLTNPGGSLPWDNVVQIRSSTGPTGSGVYLGNGYVLTAGHVGPVDNVRIGSTDFALDPAAPISIGTSDMKLVHLASDPGLGSVRLNTSTLVDTSSSYGSAYLVGYGVGRVPGSLLNTSPVTWGDVNTVAKRWGTNTIDGSMNNITVGGFTSNLLFTQFNTDVGDTEAALTLYDSGSALFRYTGSEWMLVGLGVYVEGNGSSAASTQGDSANSEDNYFIRISSYANAPDQIGAVLVPEPCSWHLLLGGLLFLGLFAFRRSFHREA